MAVFPQSNGVFPLFEHIATLRAVAVIVLIRVGSHFFLIEFQRYGSLLASLNLYLIERNQILDCLFDVHIFIVLRIRRGVVNLDDFFTVSVAGVGNFNVDRDLIPEIVHSGNLLIEGRVR